MEVKRLLARAYGLLAADPTRPLLCEADLYVVRKMDMQLTELGHHELRETLLRRPVLGCSTAAKTRLLCAIRRFEIWTATCTIQDCPTCHERHVVGGVGAGYGVGKNHRWGVMDHGRACKRCLLDAEEERSCFGADAGLWHPPVVAELTGLTYAEEAVISRIQPIIAVKMLSRGQRCLRGTVCFVDRIDDVGVLAQQLPRLPADVECVIVDRRKGGASSALEAYQPLRVRRHVVECALI